MTETNFRVSQLLVSVRSAAEAVAAIAGGCDVLDVKEPSRGPLGMADVSTIAAIINAALAAQPSVPVSVALGEAADWAPDRQPPQLPAGIAYLKLGTAKFPADAVGAAQFADVRHRFERSIRSSLVPDSPHACGDQFSSNRCPLPPRWIIVAYADFELARAPSPEQALELAAAGGCAGLLIDTATKQDKRLFDWIDESRLEVLAAQCRAASLTFAVAGRLQASDLPRVLPLCPNVIGIRSAACRDGHRDGPIDADALSRFRTALTASQQAGKLTRVANAGASTRSLARASG